MDIKKNNHGFGLLPLIVVIALIGLLILAGARISNNRSKKLTNTTTQSNFTVKSATDELDSVKLDQDLDSADIDQDIKAVL